MPVEKNETSKTISEFKAVLEKFKEEAKELEELRMVWKDLEVVKRMVGVCKFD